MHPTKSPINTQALGFYLTYQFVPKTFSGYKFPKTIDPKKILRHDERLIAQDLHTRLNNVIKTSLKQSKGPIGLLLSGGLDSTILLYLLRKNTDRKIYTISGAYASDRSHLKLCASLAKKYKTIHQELIIDPADLLELSHLYSSGWESPIGDNGLLATHLMFKALSPHAKTIYTGDGADCLFHGLRAHYLDFLDKNYPDRLKSLLLPKTDYPDYEHYKYNEIFLTKNEANKYLGADIDLTQPLKKIIKKIKTKDPIKKTILLDLNFLVINRVDYILKAASANKVKPVFPFFDPTLVNYVLTIPSKYFIKDHEQKYILKKAFANELPPEVISQKKRGMTPPFEEWYSKNRSFVFKTLAQAPALGIAPEYIRYLVKNIDRSDQYAHGMKIWLILNLVLWHNGQRSAGLKP